jgi:hypothetical protein
MVLSALPFVTAAIVGIIYVILRFIPYFNSAYRRLQAILSFLAGFLLLLAGFLPLLAGFSSHLAGLFVVTKPVELSQGVLIDTVTYDHLVDGREQMERKVLDLEAKMGALEQIANWCSLHHADPDATTQKVQQNQLATTLQQLERLRREYANIQNHCQRLEERHEDVKKTDIGQLRKVIEGKEEEISGLRAITTAVEAHPDTENFKAEKRAEELQQKLDAQIQETTSIAIAAALKSDETTKLEATNKSLQLGLKAAEEREQAVASSHKKKIEALEVAAVGAEYQLGLARDETNAAKAVIEKLQQELGAANATKAAEREQLRGEAEAMKVQLQGRFEEEIRAARKGLAEAAEADFNARVEESVATQMMAARQELAEAAETDIKSRVEKEPTSRVLEAMAERADAVAALMDLPDDTFDWEQWDSIADECGKMIKRNEADASADTTTTTTTTNMDTTMSTNVAAASEPTNFAAPTTVSFGGPVAFIAAAPARPLSSTAAPSAATTGPSAAAAGHTRKKATGKRIVVPVGGSSGGIPGLGQLPDHIVRHAQAQENAAAIAAFKARFESDVPDVNKPFEGERKKDEKFESTAPH